jgi:hypothetical protein
LALITELPSSDDALLDIGKEITLAEVEKLLTQYRTEAEDRARRLAGVRVTWPYEDRVGKDGKRTRLINPDLSPEEKQLREREAAEEGVQVVDLEDDPKRRGRIYQELRAEKYPTIRWNFAWGRYSVGGVPDGITDEFVYEYKTAGSRFLFRFRKPVAIAQADLYGYFFQRSQKRVQIQIIEENRIATYEEAVDAAGAEETLASFARVDAGEPARPPKPWKCRICDFRMTCPLTQTK